MPIIKINGHDTKADVDSGLMEDWYEDETLLPPSQLSSIGTDKRSMRTMIFVISRAAGVSREEARKIRPGILVKAFNVLMSDAMDTGDKSPNAESP